MPRTTEEEETALDTEGPVTPNWSLMLGGPIKYVIRRTGWRRACPKCGGHNEIAGVRIPHVLQENLILPLEWFCMDCIPTIDEEAIK